MKRMNGSRNHYTPEYKANIVREILREEKSISQIAADHGIHPHQLYQWRDTALAGLPALFSGQSAKEQAAREEAHAQKEHELYARIGKLPPLRSYPVGVVGKKAGIVND